jgi:hypothetical protein
VREARVEERAVAAAALGREREVLGTDWRRVVEAGRAAEKVGLALTPTLTLTLTLALALTLTLAPTLTLTLTLAPTLTLALTLTQT